MIFERPDLLPWAPLAVLLLTGGLVRQWRRRARLADAFGGPGPTTRLTGRRIGRFPSARLWCSVFATLAIVPAAAGVSEDPGEPAAPPAPVDLIIALDVSHSMTAADVEPSREARAKEAVERILEAHVADRVALTLFAGWPYKLVPLTDDEGVVDFFLSSVTPGVVEQRDQGTALAEAVGAAASTWRERARPDAVPVLLILSDGEAHGTRPAVLDSIDAVRPSGLRIWTAGVGSEPGAPLFVPRSRAAPLLAGSGGQVIAGFDPDLLRDMARRGGGAFHDISTEGGIRALVSDLRDLDGDTGAETAAPFDPTALLLLIALALLAMDAILDSGAHSRRSARARRTS